jgi:hypothetical protein
MRTKDAEVPWDWEGDEGAASWEDWIAKSVGENARAAAERLANAGKATAFDRWVGDNNIPSRYEYGKGWWDYVELIRRFVSKHEVEQVQVIGHYVIETPPPRERLPMPAVALTRGGVLVALKYDFGAGCRWPREWTVSVRRPTPYRGPTFGLFDPSLDLRQAAVEGFMPDFVFGPYRENQSEFTCEVDDEWDVATLLRLVLDEA